MKYVASIWTVPEGGGVKRLASIVWSTFFPQSPRGIKACQGDLEHFIQIYCWKEGKNINHAVFFFYQISLLEHQEIYKTIYKGADRQEDSDHVDYHIGNYW